MAARDLSSRGHNARWAAHAEVFYNGGVLPPVPVKYPGMYTQAQLARMHETA